jgi:N-acetylmuramoyl-L-alanine amidase
LLEFIIFGRGGAILLVPVVKEITKGLGDSMHKKILVLPIIFVFLFTFIFSYSANADAAKAQVTSMTVGSSLAAGKTTTISALATSPNQTLFKYHLGDRKTDTWTVLKDYSTSSSLTWTPQKEGSYRLVVHVKDSKSTSSYDSYIFEDITVTSGITKAKVSSMTVGSPLVIGSSTIVKASASSPNQTLYKYHLGDKATDEWTVLKDYTTSSSYSWVPKKEGEYRVVVHVKDSKSSALYDSYTFKDVVVSSAYSAAAKSLTVNEKAYVGYTENIVGSAESTSTALYKFFLNNRDTGEWITLQDYASNAKQTFTPQKPGNYRIVMHVKDANSSKDYDSYLFQDISVKNLSKATIEKFQTTNEMFINPANVIKTIANSDNTALYKYIVKHPDQTWETIQEFSPNGEITWKPSKTGDYRIVVHVKDSYSKNTYDNYDFKDVKVTEYPVADYQEFTTDRPSYSNQPTQISHVAKSSVSGLYKTVVRNQSTGDEKVLQNFDSRTKISWTPSSVGNYLITVYAKDQYSQKSYDDMYQKEISVSQVPKASFNSFAMNGTAFYTDKTYPVTASASSLNGALYKFIVKDETTGQWTTLRDYSINGTLNWVPKYKGKYRIVVHVKDRYSDAVYNDFEFKDVTVTKITKVVIDAGHGGSDPGAVGSNKTHEADLTLDISKRVVQMLNSREDFITLATREADKFVSLDDRVKFANSQNADLFMSIHYNSSTSKDAHGTETYIYHNSDPLFGQIVHKHLIAATGLRDRGLKKAGFAVIKNTKMPAALVEIAFISNPNEEKLANTAAFKDKVSRALANALIEYSNLR